MIAEVLLVLAGHKSSLFPTDHSLHPSFTPLLHPGEQQCLESLGLIAFRYRKIKAASGRLSQSSSRSICALCATLDHILRDEYESLVIETEAKILRRDATLVASGSFVPLSSIRATFSEWDAPLSALASLVEQLESEPHWKPGPLIDMLLSRSQTGVHRVADILSRLSVAVQRVWRTQLTALIVHGSLASVDPFASEQYILLDGSIPSCVSAVSRESIAYVGRAIGTVKAVKWQKQLPRSLTTGHTALLENVLPEDQHAFDLVISQIRTNVSEWLWLNVLTLKNVEDAVESLANYFLLRNGEFSLSVIREIERLKLSRLTLRAGPTSMIREQDLNLALLRASLGTTAQHDPALTHIRFSLPSGPVRPILPSLEHVVPIPPPSPSKSSAAFGALDYHLFTSHLLGKPLSLTYNVAWPLDLFLHPADLNAYAELFAYLSALRKTHVRVQSCWTSLSNAQRARRRFTGLGEGGTEDVELRSKSLRCGWGIVRDMDWFLDTLLGYIMMDVVDVEFRNLKEILSKKMPAGMEGSVGGKTPVPPSSSDSPSVSQLPASSSTALDPAPSTLDFTTLRAIHTTYLDRLLTGCLLTNYALTSIIRPILDICEGFVAQVERWGGDVLPQLLFEEKREDVGSMVKERWLVVAEINESLQKALDAFFEQLSLSISQQPFSSATDASKSILMNASMANHTTFNISRAAKGLDGGLGEVRRHVERLLLRLDFNGALSKRRDSTGQTTDILAEGGLS